MDTCLIGFEAGSAVSGNRLTTDRHQVMEPPCLALPPLFDFSLLRRWASGRSL